MFNPGKQTTFAPNATQAEIIRLYGVTGNGRIFPRVAPKSFTDDGETITLTPQEITRFQQTMGGITNERFGKIIKAKVTDDRRVDMMVKATDEAYDIAKKELLKNRGIK